MEDPEYPSSKRRRFKDDLEVQRRSADDDEQVVRTNGLHGRGRVSQEISGEEDVETPYSDSSDSVDQKTPEILQYDITIDSIIDWQRFEDEYGIQGLSAGHNKLNRMLFRGLGDRATSISVASKSDNVSVSSRGDPGNLDSEKVTIRISVSSSTGNRTIDRGPFEGSPEQQDFRNFWGSKAELRRFKDSAVARESLVWSPKSSIPIQIVKHLLELHCGVSNKAVEVRSVDLSEKLPETSPHLDKSESFGLIWKSFQSLSNTLLNLSALPIRIHTVKPLSAELSSSSLGLWSSQPVELFIEFESSSNWPESLPAIQHTKIAFLIKIGDMLDTEHSKMNLTTRVGLENESTSTQGYLNTSFLDIIFPPSSQSNDNHPQPLFRLRIRHEREEQLIRKAQTDRSLHGSVRDTLEAVLHLQQRQSARSAHVLAIRDLGRRCPSLSPTIRLLKQWTANHLLTSQIPAEVIETIAASVFTTSAPSSDPRSLNMAFTEVLRILADWDWRNEPLIVNLKLPASASDPDDIDPSTVSDTATTTITQPQIQSFNLRHHAWRDIDPMRHRVAATIFTSLDHTGIAFTQIPKSTPTTTSSSPFQPSGLSALALHRWQQLAQRSADLIESEARADTLNAAHWTSIFTRTTSGYDFILHLHPHLVASHPHTIGPNVTKQTQTRRERQQSKSASQYKNIALAGSLLRNGVDKDYIASIGFDPVAYYLCELHRVFGSTESNTCTFFWGEGVDIIAGLWTRPGTFVETTGEMPFRVRNGTNVRPVPVPADDGTGKAGAGAASLVVVSYQAILSEMARMGEGIVARVEVLGELGT